MNDSLKRSQTIHKRMLMDAQAKYVGRSRDYFKMNEKQKKKYHHARISHRYHLVVFNQQNLAHRVLSNSEKRNIWKAEKWNEFH